jgi:hypothetical protein
MFFHTNRPWLMPAAATLIVVLADSIARQVAQAAWSAMVPAWLVPAALIVGGFSTGLRAYMTNTVAARIACVIGVGVAISAILAKFIG